MIPLKIKGNWAIPDCKNYEEAMIITGHFYLKSTKDGSQFGIAESLTRKIDYWLLDLAGKKFPAKLEEDGVLKIGIPPEGPEEQWPAEWDSLVLDRKLEYMGCTETPAIFQDALVRLMAHIDSIAKTCSGDSMTETCRRLLFAVADEDKDKKISSSEMKMAGAMLAGLAALVEDRVVSKSKLDLILYDSFRESERVAALTMRNKDGLTYRDFYRFVAGTDSQIFVNALASISKIFPAFKP